MTPKFTTKQDGKMSDPFYLGSPKSETVCGPIHLFTQMNDVDGKEIYDGHILSFTTGTQLRNTIAEIVYEAPAFCLKIIDSPIYKTGVVIPWDIKFFENPKIVGDIYGGYEKI